jgi:hypothetical protein
MPTSTSSNGMNTNASAHKDNPSQNATVGGTENESGRKLSYLPKEGSGNSMAVSASVLPIVVKKVDTGTQDNQPDTVKASMDSIKNSPGPRQQMRGQKNSRNYNEDGKGSKVTNESDAA